MGLLSAGVAAVFAADTGVFAATGEYNPALGVAADVSAWLTAAFLAAFAVYCYRRGERARPTYSAALAVLLAAALISLPTAG